MAIDDSSLQDFINALQPSNNVKNAKATAVVERVDDEGVIWVSIPGGVDETPIATTDAEVSKGDVVTVEWRNDALYIAGNTTSPAAGTVRVAAVEQAAQFAREAATQAGEDAAVAKTAADAAQADAATAKDAAEQATEDAAAASSAASAASSAAAAADTKATNAATAAANAQTAADNAASAAATADGKAEAASSAASAAQSSADAAASAASAADQKATAAGTAASAAQTSADNAASAASTAQSSADAAILSATQANSAANGALNSLSTLQDVVGVLNWASENAEYNYTSDTEIEPGKVYWTRSGSGTSADPYVYTPVANPSAASLPDYFEIISVDEAMADFINAHLTVTDDGLYVLNDNSSYKTLIADDGMYIIDALGDTVASFTSSGSTIGVDYHYKVVTLSSKVSILDPSDNQALYISGNSQDPEFPRGYISSDGLITINPWVDNAYNRHDSFMFDSEIHTEKRGNALFEYYNNNGSRGQYTPGHVACVPTSGGPLGVNALESDHIPSLDASKIGSGTLPIELGGTGASTSDAALANLGAATSASVAAVIPFVEDTRTSVTSALTGNCPQLTELVDGQQIVFWQALAGAANMTLNLTLADGTTTGAVPCYFDGTSRLNNHYAAGNVYHLIYRKNVKIGSTTIAEGWWHDADYYKDNAARYYYYYNTIKAKSAIAANSIIVGDASGYEQAKAGVSFDLAYPVVWASAAIASGKVNYSQILYQYVDCNLATNYSSFTGTPGAVVYLVGTVSGSIFTIASEIITTTVPTTADGKVYIPIGRLGTNSTGKNYFLFSSSPHPTLFAHDGTNWGLYTPSCPFPIGAIYMTMDSANPSTLWAGTQWTKVTEGTFLAAAGTSTDYAIGNSGGSNSVTLTTDELPSHSHTVKGVYYKRQTGTTDTYGYISSSGNHSGQTEATGGGQAHENRPSYLAVAMWQRTA